MNKDEMRDQIEKARAEFKGKITKLNPEFAIRPEQTRFTEGNKSNGMRSSRRKRFPPKKVRGNEIAVIMHSKGQKKAIGFKSRIQELNKAERLRHLTTIY